jgi:ABC-type Fe3+ transport system permease subunit
MIFVLFSLGIAAAFFVSSLVLLNYGRRLGLRYLNKEAGNMAGLTTVEGAVFALIGLLLAFTISGALQRFDERRQLVIQEANAASTAHDRLGLFEPDIARDLQTKLKYYIQDSSQNRPISHAT